MAKVKITPKKMRRWEAILDNRVDGSIWILGFRCNRRRSVNFGQEVKLKEPNLFQSAEESRRIKAGEMPTLLNVPPSPEIPADSPWANAPGVAK